LKTCKAKTGNQRPVPQKLAFIFSRTRTLKMAQKYNIKAICIKDKQGEGFASKWQSP
jgi:hypothetical protein